MTNKNLNLLTVSGKKRSGKNTVATIINKLIKDKGPYEEKAFAGLLKKFASELTGVPLDGWESEKDKDTLLGPEWHGYNEYGIKIPMTRRLFLKKLGSDACNNNLHPNTWVNGLFKDYLPIDGSSIFTGVQYPKWLITDVRFPQEVKAIKDREGIVIRIERPSLKNEDNHISETALDNYKDWNFVILNNGSLKELEEKVKYVLFKLGLL